MSKLVQAVQATETKWRFAELNTLFNDMVTIEKEYVPTNSIITYGEYRVRAIFGSTTKIHTEQVNEVLPHIIEKVKRAIVEAVFGEFREDFRLLDKAVWERDLDKVSELLQKFEVKMFSNE